MPTVAVIIPVRNRAALVERALESVRRQTLREWEAIVVDDASHDATREVVTRVAREEPRVRLVEHASARGAQAARNTGVRAARSPWIAFLDSDDFFLPTSLALRWAKAVDDGVNVVHSQCRVAGGAFDGSESLVPALEGDVYQDLLRRPGPMFQGLLVRREALDEIGPLDETLVAYQEWDTAIRIGRRNRFAFVPEPTFVWDQTGIDTISSDRDRGVDGYRQVVSKHAREIRRVAGRRALADHYLWLARRYRARGRPAAVLFTSRAGLVAPLRTGASVTRSMLRSDNRSSG